MKNVENRTTKAESHIKLLKQGIESSNKKKIIAAYDGVENDEYFNWDGLDVLFIEWDELVQQANIILYS